jgi:hypothetical protein
MVTPLEYLGVFLIGCVGSGGILFGSYIGLKNYEELPKRLFKLELSIAYVLFGGAFAAILQLAFPDSFAPLYSLAVGAGWPAFVIGMATSQNAQQIANAQNKKIEEKLDKLTGG